MRAFVVIHTVSAHTSVTTSYNGTLVERGREQSHIGLVYM